MISHPACCKNPEGCQLSYVEHLRGVILGVEAIPSRAVHRSPNVADEPAVDTSERTKRWAREADAYKTLRRAGYQPRHMLGSDRLVKALGG